jgi:hypothetical protein
MPAAPSPVIRFRLADPPVPLTAADPLWRAPLTTSRQTPRGAAAAPRLGDYLGAAAAYLARGRYAALRRALAQRLGRPLAPRDLSAITLRLEKHGPFYHPLRAVIQVGGRRVSLAVNGAVSAAGRAIAGREYALLRRLAIDFPGGFLPRVYGRSGKPQGPDPIPFFLAEWFVGYHEFHLAARPGGKAPEMILWHPRHGRRRLDPLQTAAIHRGAAFILTHYYDPGTFAQIYPWHHACGDFVVRLQAGRPRLRLVTARQYAPMVRIAAGGAERPLEALLLFVLNLTLRNRIDRSDGVGDLVWAGGEALAATLAGFWAALARKRPGGERAGALAGRFRRYLATLDRSDIGAALEALLQTCRPDTPERALMARHLQRHRRQVWDLLVRGIGG